MQNPLRILHGVLVAITNFIVNLLEAIFEWGMKVLGAFATGAAQAIEAAIKAIVLVIAFILLALELLCLLIQYAILMLYFNTFSFGFPENDMEVTFFKISGNIRMGGSLQNIEIRDEVRWFYYEPLDMELPYMSSRTFINGTEDMNYSRPIFIGNIIQYSRNITESVESKNPANKNIETSSNNDSDLDIAQMVGLILLGINIVAGFTALIIGFLGFIKLAVSEEKHLGLGLATIIVWIALMILFFLNFFTSFLPREYTTLERVFYWLGIFIGCFLWGGIILGLTQGTTGLSIAWSKVKLIMMVGKLILGVVLTTLGAFLDIIVKNCLNGIVFALFFPILAISVLALRTSSTLKTIAQVAGGIILVAGIVSMFIWIELVKEATPEPIIVIIEGIIHQG
ncbi:MAG: hypothetical protein GF329_20165 [Candidatus Lokiarchaeota archaeon]|nr:hypothetical protein [Candidatus Lokiarchaeota archaeon]